MRYIPIYYVRNGMILGNPVFDTSGRILIDAGIELNEMYISHLKEYGFSGVYIEDALSRDIRVEEIISPKLKQLGMECLRKGDLDTCYKVCKEIVEQIIDKESIRLDIMELRRREDFSYEHSVNVAVVSLVIGMGMNLGKTELEDLALAALIHEFPHNMLENRNGISDAVYRAVIYHLENVDGSGEPEGRHSNEIPLMSKIIRVADAYDVFSSEISRDYDCSNCEVIEYLMGNCGILFDLKCVDTLIKYVPIYPKGTEVMLSNGIRGLIYENSGIHNLRPVVKLISGEILDLAQRKNYCVTIVDTYNGELAS